KLCNRTDNRLEAENVLKYIKTKFVRAMLGTMKVTQHNQTKEVWKNIPIQDFTTKSQINWSKSITEIDQQLYKKYNLNENEIRFIEENVKGME
ncbi:restriction endonuclease, partial [Enterococcus faecium]